MKNNIFSLDDSFREEITACAAEESQVRDLEGQYKTALETLFQNNERRIEIINGIRLAKVSEIDEELQTSADEIKALYRDRDKMLWSYCEKHRHNYVTVGRQYLGSTGRHSFSHGFESIVRVSYKCTVCGATHSSTHNSYGHEGTKRYKQEIPEALYDDTTLREDGKTFRMIEEEIVTLNSYIDYLQWLKTQLCEIFGHDAKLTNYDRESFKCSCCGKSLTYQEYINSHHRAKYRRIVDYYYETLPENDYVISSLGQERYQLPTFDDYKLTLKKKDEE